MSNVLTESQFQRQVTSFARLQGWNLAVHFPSVLTSQERGWPDLTLVSVRHRRLIFAELKRETGKLTERQTEVIAILRAAGQTVYVWRPSDWDEVAAVLSGSAA